MGSKFKLALIQLAVGANKAENLKRAVMTISEAAENGAQLVSLPGTVRLVLLVLETVFRIHTDPHYFRLGWRLRT